MPDPVCVPIVLAQDSAPAAPPGGGTDAGGGSPFGGSWMMILVIFLIFWVMLIRPQSKEKKKRELLLKSLQKKDKIVTTAGIHGEVVSVSDATVVVEIADGVRVEFDRAAIWQIAPRPGDAPAPGATPKDAKDAKEKAKS